MKTIRTVIASLILISTFMSCHGQTNKANGYQSLEKKTFNSDNVYNKYKNEKYVLQYITYKTVQTYEDPTGNLCTEALPWDMKPADVNEIQKLLTTRLALSVPELTHEQRYITCTTSIPETLSDDISELLTIQLLDYKLTDAEGNEIKIDTNNGVSLSYSSLFEEKGVNYQHILIRMNLDGESNFKNIAGGYINLKFDLASGFDKITLDKSQSGSTVSFDGEQVELLEMEHNTVHLKLPASAAERTGDWDFIPCNDKKPMGGSFSYTEYPAAFYEFARKNKGLDYIAFEKEAIANETAWKDMDSGFCLVLYFNCPVTSLYIYRPQYTSVEKRVEIKGRTGE